MTDSEYNQAINLIKLGKKEKGEALFWKIYQNDPKNEFVCLLLAEQFHGDESKLEYLEKVLEIYPTNKETIIFIKEILSRADHTKYYEIKSMEKKEINLDQFYNRYKSAILKKSDAELLRVYSLSGHMGHQGFFVLKETRYNISNGELRLGGLEKRT
jgi:hypothetical protein